MNNFFPIIFFGKLKRSMQWPLVCYVAVLFSCNRSNQADLLPPVPKHIVVIGVDGMSPNGLIHAHTPVMDDLMQNGAYTLNARGVLPTSSSTNWASMVSGAGPEQHGITSNGWERDDYILPPVVTGMEDIFPTIFGVARGQIPDMKIGAIYTWKGFGRLIERSALDLDSPQSSDEATTQQAATYIQEAKPNFLFIHLDHVDHVGHSQGHKTVPYYESISHADEQIGTIIEAVRTAGIFEEAVFIVSSDHGGIGYGHGGETIDEIEIPFIICGKGIKSNYLIKNPFYTYDNAATIASLLGIKQPASWIGKPALSAFEGYPEPELGDQKVLIAAPIIHPKPQLYDAAGGLYVEEKAKVRMETMVDATIRYTTDGTIPNRQSKSYQGPFELSQSSVIIAKAFQGTQAESNASVAYFRIVESKSKNGIRYQYYEGKDWKFLPVFESMKPLKSGKVFEFRINDISERKEQYGIQFKAVIKIDSLGAYRFYLNSDDGSKLYINDDLIVDNDGGHGTIERMGNVQLDRGLHRIRVDYHNQGGGAWLDAFYKGPGVPKQIIPPDVLYVD